MRGRSGRMQGVTLGEDVAQPQPVPEYEFDQHIAWWMRGGRAHAQGSRLKQDELSSPVGGRLVRVVIRPDEWRRTPDSVFSLFSG